MKTAFRQFGRFYTPRTAEEYAEREALPYIHTYYGQKFRHQWPLAEDIFIEDIAHALSLLCRFAGHVKTFYSVAEHCVRVSYATQSNKLYALLHDASEAYCVDVPRPLKYAPGMENYKRYEKLTMAAVCVKFGLPFEEPPEVKTADNRLLLTEKRDLFIHDSRWAVNKTDGLGSSEALPDIIVPWTPLEACNRFLMRFYELTGQDSFYRTVVPEGDNAKSS